MKLGIYIGSFNPVHKGHIKVVKFLLKKNYIDKVLIVPTLNYWDKNNLIDITNRIDMLKFFENDKILIDREHNHLIYTYELLKELEKVYNEELYLIIGADNLINFDKWKDYQKLLKYPIIVMNRDDVDIDLYLKKYPNNNFIIIKNYPYIPISSSKLRNSLDSRYLDKRVLNYIKNNKLYRGSNDENKKD